MDSLATCETSSANGTTPAVLAATHSSELPAGGGDSSPEKPATGRPSLAAHFLPGDQPDPADGGAEPGILSPQAIAQRLRKWLKDNAQSIDSAIHRDQINLGASHQTLYNLLQHGKARQKTLAKIDAALNALYLADETACGEVGPKLPPIIELPTKFPPIKAGPPALPPAPARCGRVP